MTRPGSTVKLVPNTSRYHEISDTTPGFFGSQAITKTTEIRQTTEMVPIELSLAPDDPYNKLFA